MSESHGPDSKPGNSASNGTRSVTGTARAMTPGALPEINADAAKAAKEMKAVGGVNLSLPHNLTESHKFGEYRGPARDPHAGSDLIMRNLKGDLVSFPVQSIGDGVVVRVVRGSESAGNYVEVYHGTDARGRKIISRYLHLANESDLPKVDDEVKMGGILGLAGSTGHSTGIHLHLEVRANGQAIDPNLAIRGIMEGGKAVNLKDAKDRCEVENLKKQARGANPENENPYSQEQDGTCSPLALQNNDNKQGNQNNGESNLANSGSSVDGQQTKNEGAEAAHHREISSRKTWRSKDLNTGSINGLDPEDTVTS